MNYRYFTAVLLGFALAGVVVRPAVADDGATSVRLARAQAVTAAAPLRLPARTAPAETALIFSRAGGIVAERRVDLGDRVRRGDLLAVVSAPEVDRAYAGAQAGAGLAEARLQLAQANLKRAESLIGQGYVSVAELDELRAAQAVAHAELQVAQAEVARLREIVGFQRVLAPIDGVIVERLVERGDRVSAEASGSSGYLFRIARLDSLRVELDVPQRDSQALAVGDAAELRFAELPGQTLTATVSRRAEAIDAVTGTMRVELALPNPQQRLPAGMRGEALLKPAATAGQVSIPSNALLLRNGRAQVAVVNDGTLRFRDVVVARASDREVILAAGLHAGESVVQSPNALLRDGDRVAAIGGAAGVGAP